jgi:uncharacterized protein YdeI (YjbR/CyaY-like superfamily)
MELYFQTRKEWRDWLERNSSAAEEAWLIYYKKESGKPRIPYADAVEEALCFGWIDGKIKSISKDYYIQRFTPRRPGSRWSKYNIERVRRLIKEGLMKPEGMAAFSEVLSKPHLAYENRSDGEPEIPEDLLKALKKNKKALNYFTGFPASARRIYIAWMKDARRPETRERRIAKIVVFAEKNQKPGMM